MSIHTDVAEVRAHFTDGELAALPEHVQNALTSILGFASQVDDDRARAAWMASELSEREDELAVAILDQPGAPVEMQQAMEAGRTALIWVVDQLRTDPASSAAPNTGGTG